MYKLSKYFTLLNIDIRGLINNTSCQPKGFTIDSGWMIK